MSTSKSDESNPSDAVEHLSSRMVEYEHHQLSRLVLTTIYYPIEYAKVLMQLGHEPIPPRESYTLLGRPALILPNVFQYVGHIKRTDGFFGCYNGLLPRILGCLSSACLSHKLVQFVGLKWVNDDDPPNLEEGECASDVEYYKMTRLNLVNHTASAIVSYPFQVISIRMMASFIGKEENYCGVFATIMSIFRDDGISGFFRGLIPKLVGELSCIATAGFLAYLINKYILTPKEYRVYTVQFTTYVASAFTYPLTVVSTCMTVANCTLVAGQPPLMPSYSNWYSCWRDLTQRGQHKRGGAMIYRYYIAPYNNMTYGRNR